LQDHFFSVSKPAKKQRIKMSLGGVSEASRATPEIQMIANKVSGCTSGKDVIPNQTSKI
jgi:hypothetical protein